MVYAMQSFEAVCNIEFLQANTMREADLVWASVSNTDAEGGLGWASPPGYGWVGGEARSLIAINQTTFSDGSLHKGSFDFCTFIHELGHAVGLAHPHDDGGTSTIFPDIASEFDDFGYVNMNKASIR